MSWSARAANRSASRAIQKQSAANGSSATSASTIAIVCSVPRLSRTTSNHASARSSVPVAAAHASSQDDPRHAAAAVSRNAAASAVSKPDQARSQFSVPWCAGSDAESQTVHGSRPMPIRQKAGATQRRTGIHLHCRR